jgi:hypothetical protein
MDDMLKKAGEFLKENPYLNEVELTDATGIKVRVVRSTPIINYWGGINPLVPPPPQTTWVWPTP